MIALGCGTSIIPETGSTFLIDLSGVEYAVVLLLLV